MLMGASIEHKVKNSKAGAQNISVRNFGNFSASVEAVETQIINGLISGFKITKMDQYDQERKNRKSDFLEAFKGIIRDKFKRSSGSIIAAFEDGLYTKLSAINGWFQPLKQGKSIDWLLEEVLAEMFDQGLVYESDKIAKNIINRNLSSRGLSSDQKAQLNLSTEFLGKRLILT